MMTGAPASQSPSCSGELVREVPRVQSHALPRVCNSPRLKVSRAACGLVVQTRCVHGGLAPHREHQGVGVGDSSPGTDREQSPRLMVMRSGGADPIICETCVCVWGWGWGDSCVRNGWALSN